MVRNKLYSVIFDYDDLNQIECLVYDVTDFNNELYIETFDLVAMGDFISFPDDTSRLGVDVDFFVNRYPYLGACSFSTKSYDNPIYRLSSLVETCVIIGDFFIYDGANLANLFITSSPLESLNGNGSEFIDGTLVNVSGRDTIYSVSRSYMTIYADSGYTVHYDLVSDNGAKLSCPEALLTKYIAPATTP